LDELRHLLAQLGLGTAAGPIYDMIMDLDAVNMTRRELERAIRQLFKLHGFEACADAAVAALGEIDFAGLGAHSVRDGEGKAAGHKRAS
jgi:hypothetical protein